MDVRQLATLLAIAETGSFHGAARRLHRTQSAVSHQIKALEAELGETLVLRTKPRVVISEAGRRVLTSSERILAELDGLRRSFPQEEGEELAGELRVAASTLGIVYLYGDLIGAFICKHPRIEIKVTATESGVEAERLVLGRAVDVAFAAFPSRIAQLKTMVLGSSEHVIIAAPSHPLARFDTVTVAMLREHRFVRYQLGAGSRHTSDELFLGLGGYPPVIAESNDTELIKRIIRLGLGVALVPAVTLNTDKDSDLRVLRIEGRKLAQDFGMVYRPDTRMRALDAFRKFCRTQSLVP